MNRIATAIACVTMSLVLAGCAGTATRSPDAVRQATETAQANDVFLYRKTGPFGAASLFQVHVNGTQIGTIGEAASLRVALPEGRSTIMVRLPALAGIGTKPGSITLDQSGQGPRYFRISGPMEGLLRVVKLTEIDQATYLALVK
jgi:hypothetical protein